MSYTDFEKVSLGWTDQLNVAKWNSIRIYVRTSILIKINGAKKNPQEFMIHIYKEKPHFMILSRQRPYEVIDVLK